MCFAEQEEYAALQDKYQAVKKQRIEGVENLMNEQAQKVAGHTCCLQAPLHRFLSHTVLHVYMCQAT